MLFGKKYEKLINPTFTLEESVMGVRAKLMVLVDDGRNPLYEAYVSHLIGKDLIDLYGVQVYALTHTALLKELCNTDLTPPEPCECKSPAWMEMHPTDEVEYRYTIAGRVYPYTHTKQCPKNPKNRSKNA